MGGRDLSVPVMPTNQYGFCRKRASWLLAIVWISGLVTGVLVFLQADVSFLLMRRFFAPVSIVSLLIAVLLPVCFSFTAACLRLWFLFFPSCFWKALCFSFSGCCVYAAFDHAGWLISWLILFSDAATLPFLYLFWLACVRRGANTSWITMFFLVSVVIMIGCFNIRFISPILACLIEWSPWTGGNAIPWERVYRYTASCWTWFMLMKITWQR